MRKKRIAFVVNGLYGGGAEKVLQTVLHHFNRERYNITVISYKDETINELYPADLKYKSILKSPENHGRLWAKIFNKISLLVYERFSPRIFRWIYLNERFDAEIAFIEGYATRIVSGGRSAKKVGWVHTDLKYNPWSGIAYRSQEEQSICYSQLDCVVSVSESVKTSFDELYGVRKSVVIYNPIDNNDIRNKVFQSNPLRMKEISLFISVGRLVPEKGYDRLIPIVGRLINEGFELCLWIVGEGSEKKLLENLIKKWNLTSIVTLWGFQDNPYPFVNAADWFVCSSHSEGFSTVITEAIVLGKPVIATRCAGIEEQLGYDREWGIITDNTDEALFEGMKEVLTKKSLKEIFSAKAKERGNHFSLLHQMYEIYNMIEA